MQFSVRNVTCAWVQFSTVTELFTETEGDMNDTQHEYTRTHSLTGHPTLQSTRDGVPE